MNPLSDYVKQLEFTSLKTFSLQRGELQQNFIINLNKEKDILRGLLRIPSEENPIQQARLGEIEQILRDRQYLFDLNGIIHPTSVEISTLNKNDSQGKELVDILTTTTAQEYTSRCSPFYRDAIVFYDANNNIVSVLNICLSCEYIQLGMNDFLKAGNNTYDTLREFLYHLGHPIADDYRT